MNNKHIICTLLTTAVAATAAAVPADSVKSVMLQEVSVVSSPKGDALLRQQPASVTMLNSNAIATSHPATLKGVSTMVPNLFMPDYGSRQTSAIYIRGIGSRMGTPAVGMYVDNVPCYDKSAFDFSFSDVERIDVLRGPQSTLYGRNTMGGLIKVHTKSPLQYDGTDIAVGFASGNDEYHLNATHYHRPSDKFAFSAGVFGTVGDGFFGNDNPDVGTLRVDEHRAGGLKLRGIWMPSQPWTIDMNASYELSWEGAYPYYYKGVSGNATEDYPELVGKITNNLDCSYRRGLLNAGVNAERKGKRLTFNSVTGYQNVSDKMVMDQDFIAADIYSLTQRQRNNTLSEELTLKNNTGTRWQWLVGASAFYQWSHVTGPVTFRKDGVSWLNGLINANANAHLPIVASGPMTMQFAMNDHIVGDNLLFDNTFSVPVASTAVFHQSTFNDLLGIEGLSATLGLRLDYEKMWMNYEAWYDFQHEYSLGGHLKTPAMERDIAMVPAAVYDVQRTLQGELSNDYTQLLPRFALKYAFGSNNVYATVSRGYRSGGYNVQNISEIMRSVMTTDMMGDIDAATVPVLNNQPMVPAETKEKIVHILSTMARGEDIDVQAACLYKPEFAWNYEGGTHLTLMDGAVHVDGSVFFSDVRDLQLSQMSQSGLGRITVNAGRSRSLGAELAVKAQCTERVAVMASYGYANATLREYLSYDTDAKDYINLKGNRVPFVPDHTFSIDAAYTLPLSEARLVLGANCAGAGRIYWNEQNTASEPFHMLLGARASLVLPGSQVQIDLWGSNLLNKHYNVFVFSSADRDYEQHGRPVQCGASVKWHF